MTASIAWRRWPGPIAVSRPPSCTAPGCRAVPSTWISCACRTAFAACGEHRRDLRAERERHECKRLHVLREVTR